MSSYGFLSTGEVRATRQSPLTLGRATKMIKALEHLSEEERLRQPALLSLENRQFSRIYPCTQIPEGKVKRGWRQSVFSGVQCQDKRQWEQIESQEVLSEHQETLFYCERDEASAPVVQKICRVSIPRDSWKMSEHGPEQLALGGRAWAGEVEQNDLHQSLPTSAIL